MTPEGEQPEIPQAFQQAFELPGDPTLSPDFPGPDITAALPTWRDRAEKGELKNCAFVNLNNHRFMHIFDGTSWDVKGMSQTPGIRDKNDIDGLLIESGAFRINRTDLFQVLDQMAPHMRDGSPLVVHEPTNETEDNSVAPRERTLLDHGFELVEMHGGENNVLIWEGRRLNNRAELELVIKSNPMIPRALIDSPLAQQLPPGKVLYVDSKSTHEAHSVDRNHNWRVAPDNENIYERKKGSHKLSGVVIGMNEMLGEGGFPTDLVARAGSLIQQSEDPKNPHLGGVFVVWPEGGRTPTKTELIKLFRNAGLKVDDELPPTFEAELDDGRKVIVAQARTYKYTEPPQYIKEGYIRGKGKFEMPELNKLTHVEGETCGDCGEQSIYQKFVLKHWVNPERGADDDLLKAVTICNSGKHEGGRPIQRSDVIVKNLGRHDPKRFVPQSTPRPQSSQGHQAQH